MCRAWKLKRRKYTEGNIKYMYSMKIVIVARTLRSLERIQSYLITSQPNPTRSQIFRTQPPYRGANASRIGSRLGYSFSSERSERATLRRVLQTNGLARRDIEIFARMRGASSFSRIVYLHNGTGCQYFNAHSYIST